MSQTIEIIVNGHGYIIDQATNRCIEDFDVVRKSILTDLIEEAENFLVQMDEPGGSPNIEALGEAVDRALEAIGAKEKGN